MPCVVIIVIWLAVAVATIVDRMPPQCGPLFEPPCLSEAWQKIGDIATLAWVDDWEALVGSFVALLAALLGASAIRRQMRQTERIAWEQRQQVDQHVEEARRRKLRGLRAGLPLALSSASAHLTRIASDLRALHGRLRDPAADKDVPFVFAPLPQDIVPPLQSIVELEDDDVARDSLISLASELQVLHANLRSLFDVHSSHRTHPTPLDVEVVCARVAIVSGMVDILYNYARGTNEFGGDLPSAIWNAAGRLRFGSDPNMQYVRDLLTAHYGADPSKAESIVPGLTL
ncbi:hypothetical protein [uncultured Aureimonas sp.]|uniref:hypothetical protein n=1 Tax=uncultured Aureimonas sp. TaxID=1604662 RepID=UPI0025F8F0F9|nr:hypothetical protein [uncultured Aureimonas sp.]